MRLLVFEKKSWKYFLKNIIVVWYSKKKKWRKYIFLKKYKPIVPICIYIVSVVPVRIRIQVQ